MEAGAVLAALVASACCIGPVVFAALGSGALAAASTRLQAARPTLLALTAVMLGAAFYRTYRVSAATCSADERCPPATSRRARLILWLSAVIVVLLSAFPYYAEFLF